tara:strand:+ start:491 stop:994 length:504 start_codon:yes stop_codon:yes gene_type:complete
MGPKDAQALWELDQDPEVMHFLNGGKPNSMDDIENIFIPRMAQYMDTNKGWGIWQVSDKETKEYLGWVLARPMQFFTDTPIFDDIELGWRFFKKTWGNGYATEAAIAIKDALIDQGGVSYISALAVEDNLASTQVMKKIGMSLLKKYLHEDPIGDFDAVHYQMAIDV